MTRPRVVVAAAVIGLLLALAGCNDDDPGAGSDPTTSPSATASTPSDGSSSESPSEDASPSVTPASGPLLKMPNATMHAPEGWKANKNIVDFSTDASAPDFISIVTLSALEYAGPTLPLDLQAKGVLKLRGKDFKRLPDQEIAGVTFFHLAGPNTSYMHEDLFSVRDDGYETSVTFDLNKNMSAAQREQLIAESLASFTWR